MHSWLHGRWLCVVGGQESGRRRRSCHRSWNESYNKQCKPKCYQRKPEDSANDNKMARSDELCTTRRWLLTAQPRSAFHVVSRLIGCKNARGQSPAICNREEAGKVKHEAESLLKKLATRHCQRILDGSCLLCKSCLSPSSSLSPTARMGPT